MKPLLGFVLDENLDKNSQLLLILDSFSIMCCGESHGARGILHPGEFRLCFIADALIPALCPAASGTVAPQGPCNAPVCPPVAQGALGAAFLTWRSVLSTTANNLCGTDVSALCLQAELLIAQKSFRAALISVVLTPALLNFSRQTKSRGWQYFTFILCTC